MTEIRKAIILSGIRAPPFCCQSRGGNVFSLSYQRIFARLCLNNRWGGTQGRDTVLPFFNAKVPKQVPKVPDGACENHVNTCVPGLSVGLRSPYAPRQTHGKPWVFFCPGTQSTRDSLFHAQEAGFIIRWKRLERIVRLWYSWYIEVTWEISESGFADRYYEKNR